MATLPTTKESTSYEHSELERAYTVQPLPDAVKREAGLVLDTEGLADRGSLRLAGDGHVSSVQRKSFYLSLIFSRPCFFLSLQKILMIHSTGPGQRNTLSCLQSLLELCVQTLPVQQAQLSSLFKPTNGEL
jgi:hypothetical protein